MLLRMSGPLPHLGKQLGRPYCDNCGYSFVGLTESTRCPECGEPVVEVLMRDRLQGPQSRRYESERKVLGLPLISIAVGPARGERVGKPVGIIAIGDFPRGVIAMGGVSLGVISFGGVSVGLISCGGVALGALLGLGGVATGLFALGGLAIGGFTYGGLSLFLLSGTGGRAIPLLP